MRISDWSSDVCSSDLAVRRWRRAPEAAALRTLSHHGHQRTRLRPRDPAGDPADSGGGLSPGRGWLSCHRGAGLWRGLLDRRLPRRLLSRSEEHTSELQSLMRISYAVFCLKKKIIKYHKEEEHLDS